MLSNRVTRNTGFENRMRQPLTAMPSIPQVKCLAGRRGHVSFIRPSHHVSYRHGCGEDPLQIGMSGDCKITGDPFAPTQVSKKFKRV